MRSETFGWMNMSEKTNHLNAALLCALLWNGYLGSAWMIHIVKVPWLPPNKTIIPIQPFISSTSQYYFHLSNNCGNLSSNFFMDIISLVLLPEKSNIPSWRTIMFAKYQQHQRHWLNWHQDRCYLISIKVLPLKMASRIDKRCAPWHLSCSSLGSLVWVRISTQWSSITLMTQCFA